MMFQLCSSGKSAENLQKMDRYSKKEFRRLGVEGDWSNHILRCLMKQKLKSFRAWKISGDDSLYRC